MVCKFFEPCPRSNQVGAKRRSQKLKIWASLHTVEQMFIVIFKYLPNYHVVGDSLYAKCDEDCVGVCRNFS